jgi:DNA mismatch endonuclease, patch repair protein
MIFMQENLIYLISFYSKYMVDVHTKSQRSYNMSRIKSKNTKPEMIVRSLVHQMGYRYALHLNDLPGHPDMILTKYHKIIFINGCFWHMHSCRKGKSTPSTNALFWGKKRNSNVARDRNDLRMLRKKGWKVLVIWECQTRNLIKLGKKLKLFLTSP